MSVRILERTGAIRMRTPFGEFSLEAFIVAEGASIDTHLAVVHGQLGDTVPVRINSACLTSEVFGDDRCDCAWQLEETLRRIVAEGSGVVLYHQNQEGRGIGLFRKIQSYRLMSEGLTTNEAFAALGEPTDARTYAAAASILRASPPAATWSSRHRRIRYDPGVLASCSAYHLGSLVLPTRRVVPESTASSRPRLRGRQRATVSIGASMTTSVSYSHPTARCSSSIATGSRSAGGLKGSSSGTTALIRSRR